MNRLILSLALAIALAVTATATVWTIPGTPATAKEPTLSAVLARAATAAAAFTDSPRVIYCEERYEPVRYRLKQNMDGQFEREMLKARPWVAEFSLASRPELGALGFDATQGNARQDLLAALGPYGRQALLPRVAALFLHAVNQPRFVFELGGTRKARGATLQEVRFETRQGSVNLASPVGVLNMPTSGSFWIDQAAGSVHASMFKFADSVYRGRSDWMSIEYGPEPVTKLWLPVSMEHVAADSGSYETLEGKAEYKNCRVVPRRAQ
jgi:hypothetical protein